MFLFELETYTSRLRLIGLLALVVGVGAWALDLTGAVYECPYCRTQRTVIALLGIILMLPNPRHWILRFIGSVFAFLGAFVAAFQNFNGWKKVSAGTFTFNEKIYVDPFILSGCALFIIIGLTWLLMLPAPNKAEDA
ncbi:disulfide bond formation protein B [Kordiimonas gwangyangensis]|uniref:disulfide bond formation protein B n=1 Tax=Kordiimonas gwangyangensis TaxID=288022 RepID=UPI00036AE99F|nr:disulfide bond formation protein B [Kordiimonas gwangyangensis]